MKEYDFVEYPSELYNDMYGQIQYEMIESIKNAVKDFEFLTTQNKDDLIKKIEEKIKEEKIQIKEMIDLSNFQYNIRQKRILKNQENKNTKLYFSSDDYGIKPPEFNDYLY